MIGRYCTCRMAMPTDCQYVKKMTPLMHRNLASGRMGASSALHACLHKSRSRSADMLQLTCCMQWALTRHTKRHSKTG